MAFLGLNWRFVGAIRAGDTLSVKAKVAELRETKKADRGILVLKREVYNQRGELVQEGDTTLMIARKGG